MLVTPGRCGRATYLVRHEPIRKTEDVQRSVRAIQNRGRRTLTRKCFNMPSLFVEQTSNTEAGA